MKRLHTSGLKQRLESNTSNSGQTNNQAFDLLISSSERLALTELPEPPYHLTSQNGTDNDRTRHQNHQHHAKNISRTNSLRSLIEGTEAMLQPSS